MSEDNPQAPLGTGGKVVDVRIYGVVGRLSRTYK